MIAILLQAFISPASRIAARTHFHVASASLQTLDAGGRHGQANTDAAAQSHTHPHPHSHSHLASHEHSVHSVESDDVVYVDTHSSELPLGQATNRAALDLEGFLLSRNPPSAETSKHLIFAEHAQRFRSRVEPPLERPPRIDG